MYTSITQKNTFFWLKKNVLYAHVEEEEHNKFYVACYNWDENEKDKRYGGRLFKTDVNCQWIKYKDVHTALDQNLDGTKESLSSALNVERIC